MRKRLFDDNILNPQTLQPLLEKGFTTREIAEKLGVSMQHIHNAKMVFGLKTNREKGRKKFTNVTEAFKETHRELFERFLALHNEGKTYTQIAKICGCSMSQVGKLFTVYGYSFDSSYKTRACHDAIRGSKRTLNDLEKRAKGKELKPPKMSRWEELFSRILTDKGIPFVYSKAVGKYNLDFAIGSVAVELYGGAFHATGRAAARLQDRMEFLINNGWNVYIIWCLSNESTIFPGCLDDLVAFMEFTSGNKSAVGQYRVIWSDGDFIAAGSTESDYLSAIRPSTFRNDALAKYRPSRN